MKKVGCLLFLLFFPLLFFGIIFLSSTSVTEVSSGVFGSSNVGLSEKVLSYKPLVEKYAQEYGVAEYVPHLLAIMMVESRGEGNDPMQSSESIRGLIGEIDNPEASIKQGVIHFSRVLQYAKEHGTDVWSAVQSYNYGGGFIDFVSGNWSFAQAISFSSARSKGVRVPYVNDISTKHGYDYRYDYGNMFYVFLVQQYLGGGSGNGEFKLPVPDYVVTSTWNEQRDLILQDGRRKVDVHKGIDFVYRDNRVHGDIYAVSDGEVVFSGSSGGFGNLVVLKHGNGVYSYYGHLHNISVQKGVKVSTGTVVGTMGTTGDSTGIHLHFAISNELFADFVDPTPFLGIENKLTY